MLKHLANHLLKQADIVIGGNRPHDPSMSNKAIRSALFRGSLGLGEAYVAREWECQDLPEFFRRLLLSGVSDRIPRFDHALRSLKSRMWDQQNRRNATKVAKRHYDISPEFYGTMLGAERIYTCARWKNANSLEEAQRQKNDLICRKAGISAESSVLDIGSGWGGFLAHAAHTYGAHGTGITISREQWEYARLMHASNPQLSFILADYRDIPLYPRTYDAVVSICMIEHVGHAHLKEYFKIARGALKNDGVFVLQCIGAAKKEYITDPWIDAYIFPGGELVTREAIIEATEGMFRIVDEEYFNDDYVRTLREWYRRIADARISIEAQYGKSFFRMFEYYLLSLAGAFQTSRISVGQIVLTPVECSTPYAKIRL